MRRTATSPLAILVVLCLLLPVAAAAAKKKPDAADLAAARELLDAGRPERALVLLEPYLEARPEDAEALLLRSTARIMLGETEAGRADLERSLALDPGLRQGWLNLGAVAIAEKRYDAAVEAFLKAEELEPLAPENDLNIGAVLLLAGRLGEASERFAAYLAGKAAGEGPGAEGYYLVATNYAMAGYAALAVEHLKRAIEGEERMRRRARVDRNFLGLWNQLQFQELLNTDVYRPPPGSYTAARDFKVPYEGRDGPLLKAVLDTLQLSGVPFDPNVEVAPDWALIWGEVRIKVTGGPAGGGRVELSAPPDQLSPVQWRQWVERLFGGVDERLLFSGALVPDEPPEEPPPR